MADDPAVVAYAGRTRTWRIAAVVTAIGLNVVINMVAVSAGKAGPPWAFVAAVGVGWFLSGLLPELFVRHRSPTATRVAGLDDRRPGRYLTPTSRRWLIGSYAIAAAMTVITPINALPFTSRHLVGAGTVAVVSVIGTLAVRRIAMRSQPAGDAIDLAVDDAIRTLATTRAVAGWAALQFAAVSILVPQGLAMDDRVPAITAIYLSQASFIGIIACWVWVPTRAQPRRTIASVGVS